MLREPRARLSAAGTLAVSASAEAAPLVAGSIFRIEANAFPSFASAQRPLSLLVAAGEAFILPIRGDALVLYRACSKD